MNTLPNTASSHRERIHYLDWLRALAVLGVFYAHSAYIFDTFYWHIKGVEQNTNLIVLVVFGTQWGMSLFFFLAGASAWFTLQSRTPAHFITDRFKRLLIPFFVGFVLLSPPLAYLVAISHSLYKENLLQFYPSFFTSISSSWNPQWIGAYTFHLWFLIYLFGVSVLTLPIMLYLKRQQSLRLLSRLATWCERPAGLLVFVLPIALIQITLRAFFPGYQSWSDICTWLLLLLYGFIFFAEPHFELVIEKQWKLTLFVAMSSLLTLLFAFVTGVLSRWDSLSNYSVGYVLYQVLRSLLTWSCMLMALYLGMRCFNFSDALLEYGNEAVLPFYVLHYPIIVVITFLTFSWNISQGIKFLIVSTLALLVTLSVFDLFIRRINALRWLFGMKLMHERQQEQRPEPPIHSSPSHPVSL